MVKYKKKTVINICIRALVLLLVVGLTYGIMMCCYKKQRDPMPNIIGEIRFNDENKIVIYYEGNENETVYYAKWNSLDGGTNISIYCYESMISIDNCDEKIKIFTSNQFLKTFEFDIIYNGIRKHYSISN